MKTAIKSPRIYYTVYQKQSSPSSPPYFRHLGSYEDIRDAIQAIVTAYQRTPHPSIGFGLESTTVKPKHWLYQTKYRS